MNNANADVPEESCVSGFGRWRAAADFWFPARPCLLASPSRQKLTKDVLVTIDIENHHNKAKVTYSGGLQSDSDLDSDIDFQTYKITPALVPPASEIQENDDSIITWNINIPTWTDLRNGNAIELRDIPLKEEPSSFLQLSMESADIMGWRNSPDRRELWLCYQGATWIFDTRTGLLKKRVPLVLKHKSAPNLEGFFRGLAFQLMAPVF